MDLIKNKTKKIRLSNRTLLTVCTVLVNCLNPPHTDNSWGKLSNTLKEERSGCPDKAVRITGLLPRVNSRISPQDVTLILANLCLWKSEASCLLFAKGLAFLPFIPWDDHEITSYLLFMERLYTVIKNKTGSWLWLNHELLIAKFRLKFKRVGKITRPFRYDLNLIPYDYTVEVTKQIQGVRSDRVPEEL